MTGRSISIRSTIFPERGLRIAPDFWLLPIALLLVPPGVAAAVLLAAALHEGAHALLLRAFHVPLDGLRLSVFGAVLYARGTARLSYGRELLVTLAGPAANLLCAVLLAGLASRLGWEWGFLFAGAHALLCVYNLLPVAPLDGGRALYLLAAWGWGPAVGDAVCAAAGLTCALLLTALGAYLTFSCGGALFLLSALGLLAAQIRLAKRLRSV